MDRRRMLVTGASRGIGKAIISEFAHDFDIVTAGRHVGATLQGDLRDREFLRTIVSKLDIDILVNNAGVLCEDFFETMDVNFMAAGYLTCEFYKKMESGHIINLTSYRANSPAWHKITYDRIHYNCSKAALKTFCMTLKRAEKRNVRITSLEPGWVNTALSGESVKIADEEYEHQTLERIPMKAEYIAKIIRWIIAQPQEVYVSALEIENFVLVQNG